MPRDEWQRNSVHSIFTAAGLWPDRPIRSVLDVVCGLSLKSQYVPADVRVGVDVYRPYLQAVEADCPHVLVNAHVAELARLFLPKSFDLVMALDIVEHMEKDAALAMLRDCEQIARVAVIVETPSGYVPQDIDIWDRGGDHWQTHRSGWTAKDFESLGYAVLSRPYRMSDAKRHSTESVNSSINMLDAIKEI
jgi:hypothetical protein